MVQKWSTMRVLYTRILIVKSQEIPVQVEFRFTQHQQCISGRGVSPGRALRGCQEGTLRSESESGRA